MVEITRGIAKQKTHAGTLDCGPESSTILGASEALLRRPARQKVQARRKPQMWPNSAGSKHARRTQIGAKVCNWTKFAPNLPRRGTEQHRHPNVHALDRLRPLANEKHLLVAQHHLCVFSATDCTKEAAFAPVQRDPDRQLGRAVRSHQGNRLGDLAQARYG